MPIVAITGTNGKTTTSRMIAHIFKGMGRKVGMTSTDGIVIDERLVIRADASGPKSARMVLQNPRVDFAVLEVARGGILREGLGYERNDVAVVLNVAADHLGMRRHQHASTSSPTSSRSSSRPCPATASPCSTPTTRTWRGWRAPAAARSSGSRWRAGHDRLDRSTGTAGAAGGRSCWSAAARRVIVLRQGRRSMQLAFTHLLPATFGGRARHQRRRTRWLPPGRLRRRGAHLHDIRAGLRTFSTRYDLAPGRLNHIDVDGVDGSRRLRPQPGRAADAGRLRRATCEDAPGDVEVGKRRRIGVIATAGDRRDEDLRELGEVAAAHFDVIIVREDQRTRGRAVGETAALIEEGVRAAMAAGARCRELDTILAELEATAAAMDRAHPGDLVVICVEQTSKVWTLLQDRIHPEADAGHANLFTSASAATNRSRR